MPLVEIDTRQHVLDTAQAIMARKGYAAVGLNEVLTEASVPKGSFYYYFASKDAFGEALLRSYFTDYLATMDRIRSDRSKNGAERIMEYWQRFYDLQTFLDCQGKCLVVKLAAEVSDLSDAMRKQLVAGTAGIVERLADMISVGVDDGSLPIEDDPKTLAAELYDAWIGASVLAKIQRTPESLQRALHLTRSRLRTA